MEAAEKLLAEMQELVAHLHEAKPNDRTEIDRRYAVTITEMEKAVAYYAFFIHLPLHLQQRNVEKG